MFDGLVRDRRAERREATRLEILDAAWQLVREQGLTGLTLRDLGRRVGMRPPSLYWYFASKHALYDAMFAEANRELLDRVTVQDWPDEPRAALRMLARAFVQFGIEDAARYQLLFQRTIPDFEPSPESRAVASDVLEHARAHVASTGVSDPAQFDLWTALVTGLTEQQLANDPGGDRWLRLVDDAVDMFANHVLESAPRRRR